MKTEMEKVSEANNNNAGTIKWRKHEMILVTLVALVSLKGYLWHLYHTSVDEYASPFINNHVPFNLYKNVLLPHISIGLSAYLAYLWLSLYTIPKLLFPKKVEVGTTKITISFSKVSLQGMAKKILKKYAWVFIQAILIIFILGCVVNVATYYMHQWQFDYPGFSIFFDKNNPKSQLGLPGNFLLWQLLFFCSGYM